MLTACLKLSEQLNKMSGERENIIIELLRLTTDSMSELPVLGVSSSVTALHRTAHVTDKWNPNFMKSPKSITSNFKPQASFVSTQNILFLSWVKLSFKKVFLKQLVTTGLFSAPDESTFGALVSISGSGHNKLQCVFVTQCNSVAYWCVFDSFWTTMELRGTEEWDVIDFWYTDRAWFLNVVSQSYF